MRGELVSIDLETTGFDPNRDEIIEVAAVRFRDGEILDTFQTLVNPARSIPPAVVRLTGIRDEDVRDAPGIAQVLPGVAAFCGSAPIVGHNVGFDAVFLNARGILRGNPTLDTYDLALTLLPTAPRYNLTALTSSIGVEIGTAHRALFDARATALLYADLYARAIALPLETLKALVAMAHGLEWGAKRTFEAALDEVRASGRATAHPGTPAFTPDPRALADDAGTITRGDRTAPIAREGVLSQFAADGALAASLPGYAVRREQVAMAGAVIDALNDGRHMMIEAGTGTGKTFAYLIPALTWAVANRTRVVVSTHTLTLQDQLLNDDVPAVRSALGLSFEAAALKGRANYLCPLQWEYAQAHAPGSLDELRLRARVLVWLLTTTTAERGELSLRGGGEATLWNLWSADHPGCTLDRCRTAAEGRCPFFKARRAAERAHLVIVNHALLFSDAVAEGGVLPPYDHVILDEAHQLEEAYTGAMSYRIDGETVARMLAVWGEGGRGLLGELRGAIAATGSARENEVLLPYIDEVLPIVALATRQAERFFTAVGDLLSERERADSYAQPRITPARRSEEAFGKAAGAGSRLSEFIGALADAARQIVGALRRSKTFDRTRYSALIESAAAALESLDKLNARLVAFIDAPDENQIVWLSTHRERVQVNSAPLHVGDAVDTALWSAKRSVILTSATLATDSGFGYLQNRLNAAHIGTLALGSPFDYPASTLLFLPTDLADPSDKAKYQRDIERGITELATALGGRTLALFTSFSQLRSTSEAITPRLAAAGITVLEQGDNTNRQALLTAFRNTPRTVLLATRSFWEGVDIPGDALSALVIVRLPFAVPTDPIVAARSETYADPFSEYSLADAILRFRQGFGRLIRSEHDRGVVTVFDGRVTSKQYGLRFIDALPACTQRQGLLADLPAQARAWLDRAEN
jgi:DNA polymerase-3 subunit epsilon/ATP-dependent DNA helicase DinG